LSIGKIIKKILKKILNNVIEKRTQRQLMSDCNRCEQDGMLLKCGLLSVVDFLGVV
jgi:hypothetical protein